MRLERGLATVAQLKAAPDAADNDTSMSIGLGIDLTSTEEVGESIRRFGDRYLERVYTPGELRDCAGDPARLAARFAAKEATNKALTAAERLPWRTIELQRSPTGATSLALTGAAQALALQRGCQSLAVSLSQGQGHALAIVIAEGER
jgi:holo-[acyl-carrier protein] synthase